MPGIIDLSVLTSGVGFSIEAIEQNDFSGLSVSSAGDVNDDGIEDILIGSSTSGVGTTGGAYVVFGTTAGFPDSLDLASLDGDNGFAVVDQDSNNMLGASVEAIGDINGDDVDDFIVTASGSDVGGDNDAGQAFVVFGSGDVLGAQVDVSNLDGTNGFTINGLNPNDGLGSAVAGIGDFNGDGVADFVVGASGVDAADLANAGAAYVIFGTKDGLPANLDLSTLDGTNGFAIFGLEAQNNLGGRLGAAGDINGDGFTDILIGAIGPSGGAAYVIFGTDQDLSSQFSLASLDGTNGFRVDGVSSGSAMGALGGGGDVNGDGLDDLVITDRNTNPGPLGEYDPLTAGTAYVIYGTSDEFGAAVDVTGLNGSDGFAITSTAEFDGLGSSVSIEGDINGDGFDDIVLGAAGIAQSRYGANSSRAYVLFGTDGERPATFDLATLGGSNGFVVNPIEGNDALGASVSIAGDINGDGFDDVVLGAPGSYSTAGAGLGTTFVIYGGSSVGQVLLSDGTSGNDSLDGGDFADRVLGGAGADTINGGGGNDRLRGDDGNDWIFAGDGDDEVFAGPQDLGDDSLYGGAGNDVLGGGPGDDQIEGGDGGDLIFGASGADRVSADAGNDTLYGGDGDDRLDGGSGADSLYGGTGDDTLTGDSQEDTFFFANNHGTDVVTDFAPSEDTLFFVNTVTDFADLASVRSAASETTLNGQSGLLIDTGGGNSVFLVGIVSSDLTEGALVL